MSKQVHSGIGDNLNAEGDIYVINHQKLHVSLLADIVNHLSKIENNEYNDTLDILSFEINNKIEHNHLIKYRTLFNEVKVFEGKLDQVYDTLDKEGSTKKNKVLRYLKRKYINTKSDYLTKQKSAKEIDVIRDHSDEIVDRIKTEVLNDIVSSKNCEAQLEDIDEGVCVIIFDAFMRCKILEVVS